MAADQMKTKYLCEKEEWTKLKEDLLTAVRVADEFRAEAQENVEKMIVKNKLLSERIAFLEAEVIKLRSEKYELTRRLSNENMKKQELHFANKRTEQQADTYSQTYLLRSSSLDVVSPSPKLSPVDIELSSTGLLGLRDTKSKSSQISVKALVKTLENATKQTVTPKSVTATPLGTPTPCENTNVDSLLTNCPIHDQTKKSQKHTILIKQTNNNAKPLTSVLSNAQLNVEDINKTQGIKRTIVKDLSILSSKTSKFIFLSKKKINQNQKK